MNDKLRRSHERGWRVRFYMSANENDFPGGSRGFVLANTLEGLLADAAALDVARANSVRKRRQGTEGRDAARKTLRRMVKAAEDTSDAVALDHPEVRGVFESSGKNNNDQALITAARSVAEKAGQFAAYFTEAGLPPAFFTEMTDKADDLELSAAAQAEAVGAGVDAGGGLKELLRRADEVVERLDPIVRNKYRDNPAKLAAWESARRVESAPRRKPGGDADTNNNNGDGANNTNTPPPPAANT